MTDDDAVRKSTRKAATRPVPSSSRSYDALLTFLGVRLYQERNRRRRDDEESDGKQTK